MGMHGVYLLTHCLTRSLDLSDARLGCWRAICQTLMNVGGHGNENYHDGWGEDNLNGSSGTKQKIIINLVLIRMGCMIMVLTCHLCVSCKDSPAKGRVGDSISRFGCKLCQRNGNFSGIALILNSYLNKCKECRTWTNLLYLACPKFSIQKFKNSSHLRICCKDSVVLFWQWLTNGVPLWECKNHCRSIMFNLLFVFFWLCIFRVQLVQHGRSVLWRSSWFFRVAEGAVQLPNKTPCTIGAGWCTMDTWADSFSEIFIAGGVKTPKQPVFRPSWDPLSPVDTTLFLIS